MAQVNSENSTSMPVDPTRRRFLSAAAGGATALALPAASAHAGAAPDPIFEVIEAHREAAVASAAASAECRRLHDLADSIVGKGIEVPCMIGEGSIAATCLLDIEQVIPREIFPVEHAHYRELLSQHQEARLAIHGDTDPIGDEEFAAEWEMSGEFAETVPTTLAGLFAKLIYAAKMLEKEFNVFDGDHGRDLIESLATAARTIGRQS